MDITFSEKAKDPESDVCFNSTGVGAATLNYGEVVGGDTTQPPPTTCTDTSAASLTSTSLSALAVLMAAGVAVLMA